MIELKLSIHTKRKAILEDVIRLAPDISSCSRETFRTYLELAFAEAGLSDRKIAEDLGYNVTSVRRWQSGDSCPHKALWRSIRTWIVDEAELLIKQLDGLIVRETQLAAGETSNVVALKRFPPRPDNTRPAEVADGLLAANHGEEAVLSSDGSCQIVLADGGGPGGVVLRVRRRKEEMLVRKEGPGPAPLVRTSPHSDVLREMPEGTWLSVTPPSWRIDAETIGSIFRWPAA